MNHATKLDRAPRRSNKFRARSIGCWPGLVLPLTVRQIQSREFSRETANDSPSPCGEGWVEGGVAQIRQQMMDIKIASGNLAP
jgi:hypothetical protein